MPELPRWAQRFSPSRRPTPGFLLVESAGVAYGRIPKAANSTVRRLIAGALGIGGQQVPAVNTDDFWLADKARAAGASMVDARTIAARREELFVFTVVREPFDRLKSCFEAKILDTADGERRPALARNFPSGESFEAFIVRCAATPDAQADVHVTAQAHILGIAEAGMPDAVLRLEQIEEDWERLRPRLAERGLKVRPWPQRRHRANVVRLGNEIWTAPLIARVRERYADDFRLFYPGVTGPRDAVALDG